ncbi:hypothetical protein Chor_008247 [Crotalus horridus]
MNKQRVVHVSTKQPSYAVCVLGTEICLDIKSARPRGATSFEARGTAGLQVYVTYDPKHLPKPEGSKRWPLNGDIEVIVSLKVLSSAVNDSKVRVSYYDQTGRTPIAEAWVYITCVALSLDADTSRTGTVQSYTPNKTKWTWGPDGEGAVLLVNCDRDGPSFGNMDHTYPYVRSPADLQDLSLVILNINSPATIFNNHKLILHISMFDAARLRVFHAAENTSVSQYENILGSDKLSYTVQPTDGRGQYTFYVEGLAFPDRDFNGLVSLNATLMEQTSSSSPATPVFTDTVIFHVAPWLMTPNTQRPLEIFVCRSGNRKMAKVVRDFLYAQRVQAPVELYSDWLTGFRLLLASPLACLKLFEEKQREGFGDAALFEGLRTVGKITLDEILRDRNLRQDSKYVQVNMLVLGKYLGIPKPYGPIIHGQCCLEANVRSLLEPLGLSCMFIDDFFSYHVLSGEVHCGTNVRRECFSFHWWNILL